MKKGYNYLDPEDITAENLKADEDFLNDAANYLYKSTEGDVDLTDPEEIYDEFAKRMRYHDVNEVDTVSDLMYAQEADEESKAEMARLFDVYDKSEISAEDLGEKIVDYGYGIATAPSTWIGLLTGGSGKAVSVAGQQATKEIVRRTLKGALKGALVEGAIGAGQSVAQQGTRMELDPEREFSGTEVALTAGLSALPGVALGGANALRLGAREADATLLKQQGEAAFAKREADAKVAAKETIAKAQDSDGKSVSEVEEVLAELEALTIDPTTGKAVKTKPLDKVEIAEGESIQIGIGQPEGFEIRLEQGDIDKMTAAILEMKEVIPRTPGNKITADLSLAIANGDIPLDMYVKTMEKYNLSGRDIGLIYQANVSNAARLLKSAQAIGGKSAQDILLLKKQLKAAIDKGQDLSEAVGADVKLATEVGQEATIRGYAKDTANKFERVRRSIMTSQPVTTLRNVFGGASRLTLDMFEEAVEVGTTSLYNGIAKRVGLKPIEANKRFLNSADMGKYVLNTSEADLIANLYKNIDQKGFDKFFGNFIDSSVAGTKTDGGGWLTGIGNGLNILNRMSDNFFKKTAFAGELSRLVKANYDESLTDLIKNGRFNSIDPRLFNEAMDKAFEMVYQKTPKGKGFFAEQARNYLNIDQQYGFVTGLLIPFPRFVINQIQFMYEHAPIIGMLQAEKLGGKGKVAGRSLAKRVSQQASGAMMLGTFMSLRNTQDPGTLWYNVETEDGTVDLRPMMGPMNLELYLADTAVKMLRGEPQPNLVGFSQDMVQTAIGSSMRAGTGLQLVNDVLPSLLGDLDPDGATGGKLSIANQQTLGRIAGDYLNTFTFPLPVSIARDLYSLTDEQMRQIPETNGEVNAIDIMFARAGRTLGPIREMLGMENEKDPRYSIMRSTPAKKVDPLRTATTGFNISENANEVEKEANRLQVRPYEIYRRFKFGPADVSIREKVASELPQKMSGYIRGEEYKSQNNENKRKFFKEKAREIVTGISSKVLNELGTKIEVFKERNPDATEDMIREEFGYTINDIMQYRYETEISKDNRAALESEIGKPTEDSNFSEYFFAGQVKSEQKLASGGLVQTFNVGGDVGDPLALSETAAEEDVATREQESEDYVKQMIELGLDLAPVTGEIRSAQGAIKDFEEGNPFMGTLGVIGALPLFGIFGRAAKKAYKIAKDIELPKDATEFSGELVLQHASRNPDLQQFKPVESVRKEVPSTYGINEMEPNPMLYPENVFGSKALYMDYEDGDFVTGAMDSPGFKVGKHVYQVNTTFDKAYVVTPDTLDKFAPLYKELEDRGMVIEDLPDLLKEKGYDGLIIRGFNEKYDDAMSKYKVDSNTDPFESPEMSKRYNKAKDELDKPFEELGLPTSIGQDQILDFYPERIKVVKKVSEGESLGFRTNKAPLEGYAVPDALEMTDEQIATLRESRKKRNPEVVKRFDEIEEAAKKVQSGEIPVEEFRRIADAIKPVRVWDDLPKMASNEEIASGIKPNQLANGIVGLTKSIPDGTRMTSRLDIPAYSDYDTWVVTLKGMDKGDRNVYAPAVMLKNVDLNQSMANQTKAMKVAAGAQKGPFAVMEGDYVDAYPQDLYAYADGVMDNPNWTQIGYDPTRRGYFYDRKTMEPVTAADEIIQIGPLVLGKNVAKGKAEDFAFNKGGLMSRK